MSKLAVLYLKSGLLLFILRFPIRLLKLLSHQINTRFWKIFLKKTGKNILIEYGVRIENPKQIILGNNVYIGSGTTFTSETLDGNIIIHDNVHIGRNCSIDHSGKVILEENTLLSEGVQIFSHSHGYNPKNIPIGEALTIGKNCWIGNNCLILEKTHFIAKNCIIGAGAITTKPCSTEFAIYAGSPARLKKTIP